MSNSYDWREDLKDNLISRIYTDPITIWNDSYMRLCFENATSYGRPDFHRIYDEGKLWDFLLLAWHTTSPYTWDELGVANNKLVLNPNFPEFRKKMDILKKEYKELEVEKYEAERFFSGLVLFAAPPRIFKEILGDSLYRYCKTDIINISVAEQSEEWNRNAEKAIMTFAKPNKYIVKNMQERMVLNLISVQGNP